MHIHSGYVRDSDFRETVLKFPVTIEDMSHLPSRDQEVSLKSFNGVMYCGLECASLRNLGSLLHRIASLKPERGFPAHCLKSIFNEEYNEHIYSTYLKGGQSALTPEQIRMLMKEAIAIGTAIYTEQQSRIGAYAGYTYFKECPTFSWPAKPELCSKWYGKYYIHAKPEAVRSEIIQLEDTRPIFVQMMDTLAAELAQFNIVSV
jgi:hypothetical protein